MSSVISSFIIATLSTIDAHAVTSVARQQTLESSLGSRQESASRDTWDTFEHVHEMLAVRVLAREADTYLPAGLVRFVAILYASIPTVRLSSTPTDGVVANFAFFLFATNHGTAASNPSTVAPPGLRARYHGQNRLVFPMLLAPSGKFRFYVLNLAILRIFPP